MELHLLPHPSDLFTHDPVKKTLCAEDSDLGRISLQPLYSDACDIGIAIRSNKTGTVSYWHLVDAMVDARENEVQGWKLHPTPASVRREPSLEGYVLTIFND